MHALNKEDVEVIEKRVNNTKNELEKLSEINFFDKKMSYKSFPETYHELKMWLQ